MSSQHGTNLTSLKEKNRALALQLIATEQSVSRVDLARNMHLTKTTLGNIVSELIDKEIISEYSEQEKTAELSLGRRPITLDLSPASPLIAGMLIKRNLLTVILADLKGNIKEQANYEYHTLDRELLVNELIAMYEQLSARQSRRIVAIGISPIGPVDTVKQMILSPANFWDIHDLPIGSIISEKTGLQTFLIHDSSAGALAEKLYGNKMNPYNNMLYLHIMNGIGVGYILHGKVYDGDSGQSGELGHMSIHLDGPKCSCGNTGCLELYANIEKMNEKIRALHETYLLSSTLPAKSCYTWEDIIDAASSSDFLALSALDEFCTYLARALRNTLNLLDIHHIIVGYNAPYPTTILEDVLSSKLNTQAHNTFKHPIVIEKSTFSGDAPLIGSIAVVANNIFNGSLNIF
jgi:predicted NBD/HSP70 family sugar kinase